MKSAIGRLHVITDTLIQTRFDHLALAELAITGGADTVQFRDKTLPTRHAISAARDVTSRGCRADVPVIVNDRADIAMAAAADGVHLGQRDLPVTAARHLLGPGKLIGATAGTLDQARQAEDDGADYVGFGHIYPTESKKKSDPPQGLEPLRRVCAALSIPVIAIGGIRASNLLPVLEAGAWGVAVIAAFCAVPNPRTAVEKLHALIIEHTAAG